MLYLLRSLNVAYVLTTPKDDEMEDDPLDEERRLSRWKFTDNICKGLILNGMSDQLFDANLHFGCARDLWNFLEEQCLKVNVTGTEFLITNFHRYRMASWRPIIDQFNELHHIYDRISEFEISMPESEAVNSILDKLPSDWKDFKDDVKGMEGEISLHQLGCGIRFEESIKNMKLNFYPLGVGRIRKAKGIFEDPKEKRSSGDFKRKCWNCGQPGHMIKDCRMKNDKSGAGSSGPKRFAEMTRSQLFYKVKFLIC